MFSDFWEPRGFFCDLSFGWVEINLEGPFVGLVIESKRRCGLAVAIPVTLSIQRAHIMFVVDLEKNRESCPGAQSLNRVAGHAGPQDCRPSYPLLPSFFHSVKGLSALRQRARVPCLNTSQHVSTRLNTSQHVSTHPKRAQVGFERGFEGFERKAHEATANLEP